MCSLCAPECLSAPPGPLTRALFKDPNPCAISHRMFEMPFDWGIESPVSGLGASGPWVSGRLSLSRYLFLDSALCEDLRPFLPTF